jgi:hypothetical protein
VNLITDYKRLTKDIGVTLARTAKSPEIKREAETYLKRLANVKTVDEFVDDPRVFNFAMEAFGLKDMIFAKGMMRKVLTEGIDNPQAFSMRMADSRFREFAETFNFARHGKAALAFGRAQQGTVDRYVRNAVEEQAGAQDERLRLALHFQRKGPTLTSSLSVLADKAMYTVVRTALGLPAAMSATDIDKQAEMISSRVNVEDFKDPAKLDRFITRYMAMSEIGNSAQQNSSPVASLLGGGLNIGQSTLLSIQSLRRF